MPGCSSFDTGPAEAAVTRFHAELDSEQYDQIYAGAAEDLRQVSAADDFRDLLAAVHRKLGAARSAQRLGWRLNDQTSGRYVELTYRTSFEGGEATEDYVYRMEGSDPRLAGYHINSNALILK